MKHINIAQFWLFLIFCSYLSLTSAPPSIMQSVSDKLLHSIGYLALYCSCSMAYPQVALTNKKVLLLLSYSILIELFQHFIPNRGFSILDIFANAFGLLLGLLLVRLVRRKQLSIQEKSL